MNTPSSVAPLLSRDPTDHAGKKTDPSPTSFLPSLKGFNIDNAKYKHYGHLMTSAQLEKLILRPEKPKKSGLRSSLISSTHGNPVTSPLDPPRDLARSLELPLDKGYSDETVNELLRLRIEQERTKQLKIKYELSRVVLDLLREAEGHGFGADLFRRLFVDDDEELSALLLNSGPLGLKRKLSDPESIGPSVHTPSPNKLPMDVHPTLVLQPQPQPVQHSERSSPSSQSQSRSSHLVVPAPPPPTATGLSTLPQMPVYPKHVYPVYYAQMPEHYTQQVEEPNELGLPYDAQKYPTVVFHRLPQFLRGQQSASTQGLTHAAQGHLPPQPSHNMLRQPYYYVNSLAPGIPSMVPSQYFIPPPLTSGMVPWAIAPAQEKKEEESHHHKKQKGNKSGINFMITTPKNPPARKYNKL